MATRRKAAKKPKGKDWIDEAFARVDREDAAIASTKFTTYEATIVEWLSSDDPVGFPGLRERFSHGLKGVPDDTLGRVRALVRGITEALAENDRQALAETAEYCEQFFGLGTQHKRLRAALRLVEQAHAALRDGPDTFSPGLFRFHLVPMDERFGKLDEAFVREILARTRVDRKGGARNIGVRSALAKLIAECGAFDCRDAGAAENKIKRAVERTKRPARDG